MSILNKQIIVTSTNKQINKSKLQGFLDLKVISLYNIFYYYINFTNSLINQGEDSYIIKKKYLESILDNLMYKYSNIICNYKEVIGTIQNGGTTTPNTNPGGTGTNNNTAPSVTGITIELEQDNSYTFSVSDFINNYSDAQNDLYNLLIIYPSGIDGTLTLNGVELTTTTQMSLTDVVNLVYTREDDSAFSVALPFRVSDDNPNGYLFSSLVNNTITGTIISGTGNQPATIGDITFTVENRSVTVLTLAMFTSLLTPPYNDPENDLIDAIRIDEVSTANKGIYYLNGIPIVQGQIITREQINANLFIYEAPNQDDIWGDTFEWSARDEGSGIWVN